MNCRKITLIAGVVTAAASLLVVSSAAHAGHSWGNYHWARTSNPFTLQLGNNLSTQSWKDLLSSTSTAWNASSYVKTAVVSGKAKSNCSAVSGTTQVCNKTYGNNGWLGLATIYISGSHITSGTSKMNDTYLSVSGGKYNTFYERLHVMCQEVAHTFGLGHQDESGISKNTCMDYYSNTGNNAGDSASTTPDAHDFEQLQTIYTHLDTSTTVATSLNVAAATPSIFDVDAPQNWGRLMSQSQNGRSSYYEQHLNGGLRIVRHVLWTEERAAACSSCDHRFHTDQK